MSGPSSGAMDRANAIVDAFLAEPHETLRESIAEQIQESFDLGHKSADGAQYDTVPAMGGFLEIALDQEEIDVVGEIVSSAEPKGERACAAVGRFLEKIELFRRKPR